MIAGPPHVDVAPGFAELGVLAFTTTREFGNLGLGTEEPVGQVMARWRSVTDHLRAIGVERLATAGQVHGARVVTHGPGWAGWLLAADADGHAAPAGEPTALAVTVADCVPVFIAHASGAVALLHSGWRGTEARMIDAGIAAMAALGCPARELVVHLGPAICGRCYEVSPDVYERLTGRPVPRPTPVDLRQLIAGRAGALGVRSLSVSARCTRCDNGRFFSHRAGDAGRQISLITAPGAASA